MTSGKWYWEVYNKDITSVGWTEGRVGIFSMKSLEEFGTSTTASHDITGTLLYSATNGKLQAGNGTGTPDDLATLSTYTNGDIIGIAVDMDASTILLYKNGSVQNSGTAIAFSAMSQPNGIADGALPWFNAIYSQHSRIVNFGQDSSFAGEKTAQGNGGDGEDFYYTPPTGYKALNTSNLDDPAIALPTDHFETVLWTGDGADTKAIAASDFVMDFTWIKNRSAAENNVVWDRVRGTAKRLVTNTTGVESDISSLGNEVEFTVAGMNVGSTNAGYEAEVNKLSDNYTSWNWKAGGTPTATNSAGAGATPTAGSVKIDGSNLGSALAGDTPVLKLSANTTNGFSIGTYSGDGATATIAHGLSQAPELIIVKCYDGLTFNWTAGWGAGGAAWTDYMHLDTSAAAVDDIDFWRDTYPTSSVFTVGANGNVNYSGDDFIFYAWHSVEGYSKVGSFTGNNSVTDNAFVYTGFKPAFLLVKNTGASGQYWTLWDNKRDTYNVANKVLEPNDPRVEQVNANTTVDFLSNGFKPKNNNAQCGGYGSFLYYAVAESPFKYSNAR